MNPPGLVLFSPLPPATSGIADYTAELLPALAALRPLVVVCERPQAVAMALPAGCTLRDPAAYAAEPALHGLPHIYQLGNNRDHVFVYQAFRQRPGVLVQHDFNLHYLLDDTTLLRRDAAGYAEVLAEEYGPPGRTLAHLRQLGLFSESQKLVLGVNTHLARQAPAVIVHSHWVRERLPPDVQARTTVLPHHGAPQAQAFAHLSRREARAQLGLPQDRRVVLSLGYITPPKQIDATLAAMALLAARGDDALFVIGGARNPGYDIDAQVQARGLAGRVRVTGFLDETTFFTYIVAADVLVNLRHPTVGESSGTLARAMALGLPAIVHNFGPMAEVPDAAALKVPLELGEPLALAAALETLLQDAALRRRLGAAARRYMRQACSVEQAARRYVGLVDEVYGDEMTMRAA
ncbi:MAG: glycosyltransferase [Proteobacteria bacterium]|nr:glycosyltransferase [Pseudomonadota bacterium]